MKEKLRKKTERAGLWLRHSFCQKPIPINFQIINVFQQINAQPSLSSWPLTEESYVMTSHFHSSNSGGDKVFV